MPGGQGLRRHRVADGIGEGDRFTAVHRRRQDGARRTALAEDAVLRAGGTGGRRCLLAVTILMVVIVGSGGVIVPAAFADCDAGRADHSSHGRVVRNRAQGGGEEIAAQGESGG